METPAQKVQRRTLGHIKRMDNSRQANALATLVLAIQESREVGAKDG